MIVNHNKDPRKKNAAISYRAIQIRAAKEGIAEEDLVTIMDILY